MGEAAGQTLTVIEWLLKGCTPEPLSWQQCNRLPSNAELSTACAYRYVTVKAVRECVEEVAISTAQGFKRYECRKKNQRVRNRKLRKKAQKKKNGSGSASASGSASGNSSGSVDGGGVSKKLGNQQTTIPKAPSRVSQEELRANHWTFELEKCPLALAGMVIERSVATHSPLFSNQEVWKRHAYSEKDIYDTLREFSAHHQWILSLFCRVAATNTATIISQSDEAPVISGAGASVHKKIVGVLQKRHCAYAKSRASDVGADPDIPCTEEVFRQHFTRSSLTHPCDARLPGLPVHDVPVEVYAYFRRVLLSTVRERKVRALQAARNFDLRAASQREQRSDSQVAELNYYSAVSSFAGIAVVACSEELPEHFSAEELRIEQEEEDAGGEHRYLETKVVKGSKKTKKSSLKKSKKKQKVGSGSSSSSRNGSSSSSGSGSSGKVLKSGGKMSGAFKKLPSVQAAALLKRYIKLNRVVTDEAYLSHYGSPKSASAQPVHIVVGPRAERYIVTEESFYIAISDAKPGAKGVAKA